MAAGYLRERANGPAPYRAGVVLVLAALLASLVASDPATPDWGAMLRDPAASCRWLDGDRLLVVPSGGEGAWVIDARTGTRSPADAAARDAVRALGGAAIRSEGGGRETSIRFRNGSPGEVRLLWVEGSGRERPYGSVAAGASRAQHTFEGHAWVVRDASGRALGWIRGEALPVEVAIDGSVAAAPVPEPTAPGDPPPPLPAAAAARSGPHLWAPGGGHVVAFETVEEQRHDVHLVESSPPDGGQPRLRTIQYLKPGDRIAQRWPRLFRADGDEVPLDRSSFANPWSVDGFRWTADGRTFTFVFNERGHQALRMLAVDAASGAVRTVVEERSPTFVDYAHKCWWHWIDDRELLWMSERDGFNHLYLVDASAGGPPRAVTSGPWMVRAVESVDAAARTVTLRAMGLDPGQDPYHVHFLRVPIDGGPAVRLTQGDGTHALSWSPSGAWYVDTWSRVDLPPVHELRRATDGALVAELGRADAGALVEAGWTWPERFAAPGRDGTTMVHGVIWRPGGTGPGASPMPVVEHVYAGPQDFHVPKAFSAWHGQRAVADAGFVVVQVDGMGTNWRGKRFHDACWKDLRDSGLPDHVAWIRAAAAERPWMDLSRVGIYGGSAGGQSAMRALLDFPGFYSVGVADCGCHDNRMDKIWWNELWMGWPVDESYVRSSNVADAARLQGKLMLVVGELDENVDPASTMQVSAALVRAGKAHDLVVIPGAGHGAAETPYGSARRLAFLRRHLLGTVE